MSTQRYKTLLAAMLFLFLSACGVSYDGAEGTEVEETGQLNLSLTNTSPEVNMNLRDNYSRLPSDPTTEMCNGKCCNWVCNNGLHGVSRRPECGECQVYAAGWCSGRGSSLRHIFWHPRCD